MVDEIQEQIKKKIAEEVNCNNETPLNLSFRYFRYFRGFRNDLKRVVVSIGWKQEKFLLSLPSVNMITYTIAICSPKDHFSRKKAREIIMSRFENKNFSSFIIGSNDFSGRAIPELIRIHYGSINNGNLNPFGIKIPKWAKYI